MEREVWRGRCGEGGMWGGREECIYSVLGREVWEGGAVFHCKCKHGFIKLLSYLIMRALPLW